MALGHYLSVAEADFRKPGKYDFRTGILDLDGALGVRQRLADLGLVYSDLRWGFDGLVVEFRNDDDLAFFALAYDGALAPI